MFYVQDRFSYKPESIKVYSIRTIETEDAEIVQFLIHKKNSWE
jgi:hypothetical protein